MSATLSAADKIELRRAVDLVQDVLNRGSDYKQAPLSQQINSRTPFSSPVRSSFGSPRNSDASVSPVRVEPLYTSPVRVEPLVQNLRTSYNSPYAAPDPSTVARVMEQMRLRILNLEDENRALSREIDRLRAKETSAVQEVLTVRPRVVSPSERTKALDAVQEILDVRPQVVNYPSPRSSPRSPVRTASNSTLPAPPPQPVGAF